MDDHGFSKEINLGDECIHGPSRGHESLARITAFNPDRMNPLQQILLVRQTREAGPRRISGPREHHYSAPGWFWFPKLPPLNLRLTSDAGEGKKKKKEYICIKRRTKRKRKWGALSCPMERRHDKCTESDFRNCLKSLSRVVRNSPGIHGECVTAKSHAELCSPQSCLPVPCLERLQSRTDPSQLQSLSLSRQPLNHL